MNEKLAVLTENQKDFMNFLKGRYSLYHLSNVFFRDLHYGVMAYFNLKNVRHRYSEAETVTRKLVESLESQEILRKIDSRSFMLNYPDFKKPSVKRAAPAKPAAKPAAQSKPVPAESGKSRESTRGDSTSEESGKPDTAEKEKTTAKDGQKEEQKTAPEEQKSANEEQES